ncbi:protein CMSS1 [Senna tora]|uniref:Protein CMSS1 n=1 Tax=Senna tora TaxID=362788 RepID=A0A834SQQ8_9FABA|nr:protein CMSS1 [Senna tora]
MTMGSQKEKRSSQNPSSKLKSLAPKGIKTKRTKNQEKKKKKKDVTFRSNGDQNNENIEELQPASAQLSFFADQFQSAKGVQLSSLELETLKETSFLELPQDLNENVKSLGKNIKAAFGQSWKEVLCEGQLVEGKIEAGSPAVLIISSSALRSIELLRGFRSFTEECHAVKLFSKHMKVEEQISLLKNRVNIASGTPSRIKKLIDTEALGLSRLQVLLLDIHPDVKGYSLFTLPQVSDEFWDLFKTYFYQPMVQGDLRICLYGDYRPAVRLQGKRALHNHDKSKI